MPAQRPLQLKRHPLHRKSRKSTFWRWPLIAGVLLVAFVASKQVLSTNDRENDVNWPEDFNKASRRSESDFNALPTALPEGYEITRTEPEMIAARDVVDENAYDGKRLAAKNLTKPDVGELSQSNGSSLHATDQTGVSLLSNFECSPKNVDVTVVGPAHFEIEFKQGRHQTGFFTFQLKNADGKQVVIDLVGCSSKWHTLEPRVLR